MVERLKVAIEKARRQREAGAPPAGGAAAPPPPSPPASDAWGALAEAPAAPAALRRARVVTQTKAAPEHVRFDLLRTRVLKHFAAHDMTSLAVSSPTTGCGKSFVCANLAFSMARAMNLRTVLIDLDLRRPTLAPLFGPAAQADLHAYLTGAAPLTDAFVRIAPGLAFAGAAKPVAASAELMQARATGERLAEMVAALKPDLVIYDLPPLLVSDDVLGFLHAADAIMLVAGAGTTRARDVEECERLIGDGAQILGVVLNKTDNIELNAYDDYYGAGPVAD